jgi:hypothetical protein
MRVDTHEVLLISSAKSERDSLIIFERSEVFSGIEGAKDCKPCFFDNLS